MPNSINYSEEGKRKVSEKGFKSALDKVIFTDKQKLENSETQ